MKETTRGEYYKVGEQKERRDVDKKGTGYFLMKKFRCEKSRPTPNIKYKVKEKK